MRNNRVSNRAATTVILIAIVAASGATWAAVWAKEPKTVYHPKTYCTDPKCHMNLQTQRKMLEKMGQFQANIDGLDPSLRKHAEELRNKKSW